MRAIWALYDKVIVNSLEIAGGREGGVKYTGDEPFWKFVRGFERRICAHCLQRYYPALG